MESTVTPDITKATIASTTIATAAVVKQGLDTMVAVYGAKAMERAIHAAHMFQDELEKVQSMAPGTLLPTPDGGIPKNPSS